MRSTLQAYLNVSARLPNDESVKKRLERAWQEVLAPGYEITETKEKGKYKVSKASTSSFEDTSRVYYATVSSCTCPDVVSARAGLCKHRLAVMILEEQKREGV